MNRKTSLLLALSVLLASTAFAADTGTLTRLNGTGADLDRQIDTLSARMGKVSPANASFGELAKRKGATLRIAFSDVGRIVRADGTTSFVGRHPFGPAFDFAQVTFPSDIQISTRSAAVVVGSIIGAREVENSQGQKTTLAVVSAKIVGVIDGGTQLPNGVLSFGASSPIRVYQIKAGTAAKKSAPKKK